MNIFFFEEYITAKYAEYIFLYGEFLLNNKY